MNCLPVEWVLLLLEVVVLVDEAVVVINSLASNCCVELHSMIAELVE